MQPSTIMHAALLVRKLTLGPNLDFVCQRRRVLAVNSKLNFVLWKCIKFSTHCGRKWIL